MTEGATRWIDRNLGRLVTVVVAGTIVCLGWGVYLQFQVSSQARDGSAARARQQAVFPVSEKIYVDAYKRHVISQAELACFRTGRRCPPVTFRTP